MENSLGFQRFVEDKRSGRDNLAHLKGNCGCRNRGTTIVPGPKPFVNRVATPVPTPIKKVQRIVPVPKIKKIVPIEFGDPSEGIEKYRTPGFVPEPTSSTPKKLVTATVKTDNGKKEAVKTGVLVKTPEKVKMMEGGKDNGEAPGADTGLLLPLGILGTILGIYAIAKNNGTRTITV